MEILRFGPQETPGVNISLHGMPGMHSRQNRDIAETVAQITSRRTEVVLYSGLGFADGVFGFRSCIAEVDAYTDRVVAESANRSLHLIGHSWGGYLALRTAVRHASRVRKLVLMSPILRFAAPEEVVQRLKADANDPRFRLGEVGSLIAEFGDLQRERAPIDLINELSPSLDVLFMQAENDPITPDANAAEAIGRFQKRPIFEKVATDHSFVIDRPAISQRIGLFLRDS